MGKSTNLSLSYAVLPMSVECILTLPKSSSIKAFDYDNESGEIRCYYISEVGDVDVYIEKYYIIPVGTEMYNDLLLGECIGVFNNNLLFKEKSPENS
jgi:hypothetical protein